MLEMNMKAAPRICPPTSYYITVVTSNPTGLSVCMHARCWERKYRAKLLYSNSGFMSQILDSCPPCNMDAFASLHMDCQLADEMRT